MSLHVIFSSLLWCVCIEMRYTELFYPGPVSIQSSKIMVIQNYCYCCSYIYIYTNRIH